MLGWGVSQVPRGGLACADYALMRHAMAYCTRRDVHVSGLRRLHLILGCWRARNHIQPVTSAVPAECGVFWASTGFTFFRIRLLPVYEGVVEVILVQARLMARVLGIATWSKVGLLHFYSAGG